MVSFEAMLVRCLNEYYDKKNFPAIAYKLPMVRYHRQGFDIYSDSRMYYFYTAIECKSIDAEKEQTLYFSQYFHHVNGVHQLDYEDHIINKTGRYGFLAVELRRRRGVRKSAYLVPWRTVIASYKSGEKGLDPDVITDCCELSYSGGGYHITDEVEKLYLNDMSGKPFEEAHANNIAIMWNTRPNGKK